MSCSQANIWSEYLYYQHGFSATRLPTHENPHPDLASPSRRVCDDHTKRRLNMCSHQCHTQFFARAGVRRLGRVIVRTTLIVRTLELELELHPPPPQKKTPDLELELELELPPPPLER